ncbi:hypothetical protein AKO1_011487 [Acrasis kona]|uniref:Zn(2)-C6 fungal-type domain-containing protein n=1 Tax=Acrasis kona TaxID=1008807 RepID=A0AAW2Z1G0_9EUKA
MLEFIKDQKPIILAQQSCSNCRKMHKRCDRVLPECGLCSKRNKICCYDDQSVRRTLPKASSFVKQRLDPFAGDMSDFIVRSLNYNMPILSPEKIRLVINAIDKESRGSPVYDPNIKSEEIALVFSVLALSTKYKGNLIDCKIYFDRARSIIAPDLELIIENYVTAACCCFIGTYCALELDVPRAQFYVTLLRLFIDVQSQQKIRDKRLNFIEHEYITIKSLLSQEADMEMMLKKYFERLFSVLDFYKQDNPSDVQLYANYTTWLTKAESEKIFSDLRSSSNKEFPLNPERFERISKTIMSMYKGKNINLPELSERWAISMLVLHGAQLQYFRNLGDRENARKEADIITEIIVERKSVFKMAGVIIRAAANIHLEDFDSGLMDRSVLIQKLRQDYIAVSNIANSSHLWKVRLEELKSRLEETIWTFTNYQNAQCNNDQQLANTFNDQDEFLSRDLIPEINQNPFDDLTMTENEFEELLNNILS